MSKITLENNLRELGIPDRAAFDAMVSLTPATIPYKEEMLEVLESINPEELVAFMNVAHPTDLAIAFRRIKTD